MSSSICPSQLLSKSSHNSTAPGLIAEFKSLQSLEGTTNPIGATL